MTNALRRAVGRYRSVLIDFAEHPVGFPTGTGPQDDGGATAAVVAQLEAAPAVLLATPTYRGSMTGVLNNKLDQVPLAALRGKPVGCVVMGASQHHFLGADRHLRDVLADFGALVTPVTAYLISADFADDALSEAAARDLVDGSRQRSRSYCVLVNRYVVLMGLRDWIAGWRRRKRDPGEVFTPKSVVTREMFARRNEPDLHGRPGLQDRLRRALRDKGGQVLMYGDTGVGKSSLLKYAAEDERMAAVTVECFSDRTYEELIQECIGRLVDFQEVTFSESYASGRQVALSVGAKKMTVKGEVHVERGHTRTFVAVQKEPSDVLIDAMRAAGRSLIVLDNFQNVNTKRTRLLVAQTMERLSDRADETGDIKLVVIGIADDAPALLSGAGSFTRRTAEVGVPRMPNDEIEQILERGFRLLGLSASPEALKRLVFFSDGFPYFAHLLGQSVAQTARRERSREVTLRMVEQALTRAAEQVEEGYGARVRKALEAGGQTQPRKRILELLAYDDSSLDWRSTDVIRLFATEHGERNDWSFLHTALAALTREKHGAMLKRTGTKGRYVYRFSDPHMRPYLRLAVFPRVSESGSS